MWLYEKFSGSFFHLLIHTHTHTHKLPTNVHLVKATVFPIVMYGSKSWIIKLSTEELMLLNCGVGEDS